MCSGEYCAVHFSGPCNCDVLDRHDIGGHKSEATILSLEQKLERAAIALRPFAEDYKACSGNSDAFPLASLICLDLTVGNLRLASTTLAEIERKEMPDSLVTNLMKETKPGDIVLVQQEGKAPYTAVKLSMDNPKIQNEIHVSPLTEIRVTSEASVTKIEPT